MRESIKIVHAALDEVKGGEIILRGVLDPASLHLLKVGDYQLEVLPLAKISELIDGFKKGSVPDVDLGMRGGDYLEREGVFYLKDDIYIIDGLQRVTAARHMLTSGGDTVPRLGATIHFNTTEESERQRFRILNVVRTKLSPNVLLRNMRAEYPVVETLYHLTDEKSFVLNDRVCWAQRMQRGHLLTALTFFKVTGLLHAHLGPGRSHRLEELGPGVQKIMERVGKNTFRDNVKTFFDIIDQCWGIRTVAFKEGAAYLRGGFLWSLAMIFSDHPLFWRGNRLFVEMDLVRKIKGFPLSDPSIVKLASSGGQSAALLYQLLVNHINSGKRTRRLVRRDGSVGVEFPEDDNDGSEDTDLSAASNK